MRSPCWACSYAAICCRYQSTNGTSPCASRSWGCSHQLPPDAQSSADQKYAVQPHTTGPSVFAVGSAALTAAA